MPECIHGFDEGLCDVCYPREPAAGPGRGAGAATRTAGARSSRSSGGVRRTSAARETSTGAGPASFSLGTQRVYHVTHVHNLDAILADGAIRADAAPPYDVSSPTARELRAVGETPLGDRVSDHVAFYLTPEANRWRELRAGAAGSHWSVAARTANRTEFVVLAVPVARLGAQLIVADGDAAAADTRFAVGADAGTALLRQRRVIEHGRLTAANPNDPDAAAADVGLRDAELLAGENVPVSAVALIGVANDPMRDRVRGMLADAGATAVKVAVYPPWFQ